MSRCATRRIRRATAGSTSRCATRWRSRRGWRRCSSTRCTAARRWRASSPMCVRDALPPEAGCSSSIPEVSRQSSRMRRISGRGSHTRLGRRVGLTGAPPTGSGDPRGKGCPRSPRCRMALAIVPRLVRRLYGDALRAVAEQALAHVNTNRVEAAYMRSDLFEWRRELMEAWGDNWRKRKSRKSRIGLTSYVLRRIQSSEEPCGGSRRHIEESYVPSSSFPTVRQFRPAIPFLQFCERWRCWR